MAEVLDRTYHIILEVDVDNPIPSTTELVPYCMGHSPDRTIDTDFYLYSPEDSQRKWMAITIEEPYDYGEGSRYVPVVPAELDYVQEAISRALARILVSGTDIVDHDATRFIREIGNRQLLYTTILVEDGNHLEQEYDRYYVKLYFTV